MPHPKAVTGPFYPHREGARCIRMLAEKGKSTSRITATMKGRMKAKAHCLGINITFVTEEFGTMLCVAVLTDAVRSGNKPKRTQQAAFEQRANRVMGLAGTAHDVPEAALASAA